MNRGSVDRRYARALFELLDPSAVDPVRKALRALSEAVHRSGPLTHVLASPAFGKEQKVAVLAELSERLGAPPVLTQFLRQLIAKNRVSHLGGIADALDDLADEAKGTKAVSVTSAAALPAAEQRRLQDRLRDFMQGQVTVQYETDPTLLAGLRIRVGSMVYDSSLRNRFATMRTLLTKE